ncbi:hypothetical protein E2C01_094079 [Portunus trituberculatus]|uniref:Uncharacterized protein n=1 Tax=Portunus trituberculatus TaxID=210409 RepID=A0A5B7JV79_PORTR|nr:hypothetical protein [Portunus trituberculatus]
MRSAAASAATTAATAPSCTAAFTTSRHYLSPPSGFLAALPRGTQLRFQHRGRHTHVIAPEDEEAQTPEWTR